MENNIDPNSTRKTMITLVFLWSSFCMGAFWYTGSEAVLENGLIGVVGALGLQKVMDFMEKRVEAIKPHHKIATKLDSYGK